MILTRHNLFDFLRARGLLAASVPLDGRLEIQDRSGRNRSFQVEYGDGDGCFVKQGGLGVSPGGRHPEREAACFQLAPDWPELRAVLPALKWRDASGRTLVMELIPGDNLLRRQSARKAFVVEYAASLGDALGALSASASGRREQLDGNTVFPAAMPWILHGNWSERQLKHGSPSGGQASVAGIVREYPEVLDETAKTARLWTANALLHGDMKLENCLRRPGLAAGDAVVIVDWEFADFGDALWDAGGVIQSWFNQWLHSVKPTDAEESLAEAVRSSELPMDSMRAAIGSFWVAYAKANGWDGDEEARALEKALRFAGARLMQTAYEWAGGRRSLTWHAVRQVQAGVNLMARPAESATQIMGGHRT